MLRRCICLFVLLLFFGQALFVTCYCCSSKASFTLVEQSHFFLANGLFTLEKKKSPSSFLGIMREKQQVSRILEWKLKKPKDGENGLRYLLFVFFFPDWFRKLLGLYESVKKAQIGTLFAHHLAEHIFFWGLLINLPRC